MKDQKICSKCNQAIESSFNFCPHCGSREFKKNCSKCNQTIESSFNFCPHCGSQEFNKESNNIKDSCSTKPIGDTQQQKQYDSPSSDKKSYNVTQSQTPNPYDLFINKNEGEKSNNTTISDTQPQEQYDSLSPNQNPFNQTQRRAVYYSMKWYNFLINFALFFGAFVMLIFGVIYITGDIYELLTNGNFRYTILYARYNALRTVDTLYGIFQIATAGFMLYTRFCLAKYKYNGPTCTYIIYASQFAAPIIYQTLATLITKINMFEKQFVITSIISIAIFIANYAYFQKRRPLFFR